MTWSRQKSLLEDLMSKVLENRGEPMSIGEIVEEIKKIKPQAFTGKTEKNSLYSVLYRKERRRKEAGEQLRFTVKLVRGSLIYSINKSYKG